MATFSFESHSAIVPEGKTGIETIGVVTYSVTSNDSSTVIKVTGIDFTSVDSYGNVQYGIRIGGTSYASGTVNVPEGKSKSVSLNVSRTYSRGTSDKSVRIDVTSTTDDFEDAYRDVTVPKLPSYAVTYNANGGTGAPASQSKFKGVSLTLSSTTPTRAGYTFKEWCTNTTDTGTRYSPGATYTANASLTLYAIWNPVITYKPNGGSGSDQTQGKTYGTAVTIKPANTFSRTNHVFRTWNTNSAGTGFSYAAGSSYTSNSTLTLYAIWYPPYTITYYANGGSGAPGVGTKVHGQTYTISSTKPTRTGYRFMGWGTSPTATTNLMQPGASYTTNANLTLYAIWKLDTVPPTISSLTVVRCDQSGVADDFGTYCKVTAKWSVDTSSEFVTNNYGTVTGQCKNLSTGATTDITWSNGSGGSGVSSATATATIPNIDTDYTYVITVTVRDKADSSGVRRTSSRSDICTASHFILDFKEGGQAIGIGMPAPSSGLGIGWPTLFSSMLNVKDSAIDRDSSPSSTLYSDMHSLELHDKDGRVSGRVRIMKTSGGTMGLQLVVFNEPDGGGTVVNNTFGVQIGRDGTRSYYMSDPAAFRSAIASIAKDGDTMTGSLKVKDNAIDRDSSPSSSLYSDSHAFDLLDKDGELMGKVRITKGATGVAGIQLVAWNEADGGSSSAHYNVFHVGIGKDGTRSYSMSDPAAFRSAIGLAKTTTDITRYTDGGEDIEVTIVDSGSVRLVRNPVMATVHVNAVSLADDLASGSSITIGTVPTGYRPSYEADSVCTSTSNSQLPIRLYVTTGGNVILQNRTGANLPASRTLYGTVTYVI